MRHRKPPAGLAITWNEFVVLQSIVGVVNFIQFVIHQRQQLLLVPTGDADLNFALTVMLDDLRLRLTFL